MTVKLIRMWSGEDVIADIVEETTDSIAVSYTHLTLPTNREV